MRRITAFAVIGLVLMLGTEKLFAQRGGRAAETLEVRLGSPLPRESPWGRTLDRLAAEWSRVTNGQVRLNVRHGGIEGGEDRMLLSMASNNLQAGIFTSFGLSQINPAVLTLSTPFLIRNERELDVVMREVQSDLEAGLNSGNNFLLAWSKAGFINIFSRDPVFTPDDLRRQRIGANPEAAELNAAFTSMGFQMVEADWGDLGARINAGTVQAVYLNPPAVAAFQLHTTLRNMHSMNIAPVMGGIVINQVTWRRIGNLDPSYQQELLSVTRRLADEFDSTFSRTVDDAVRTMTRAGLRVNESSPAQEQIWYNEMERAAPSIVGSILDRDMYNRISAILARHRGGP